MSYSRIAVLLHWSIAILIIAQLIGGSVLDFFADGTLKFTLYQWHKTFGLIVLALSLSRLYWRLINPVPPLSPTLQPWEKKIAHLVHIAFYGVMILVPLSGWIMVSGSKTGVPTYFLMLESLPFYHLPTQAIAGLAHEAHEILSNATIALIALHVGGALKHQIIDKEPAIERMTLKTAAPAKRSLLAQLGVPAIAIGFLALGVVAGIAQEKHKTAGAAASAGQSQQAAASTTAPMWQVSAAESTLTFTLIYEGREAQGSFTTWQANIAFDPDRPETSAITVTIDLSSVSINDGTLQGQAKGADGFDISNHPQAVFTSTSVKANEGGYVAEGTLSMRGQTVPTTLTFTFQEVDGVATVTGSTTLDRTNFGIGAASAPSEATLKNTIEVGFAVKAKRAN